MTLTQAGKAFAMCTIGGGGTNSSQNTSAKTAFKDIQGAVRYLGCTKTTYGIAAYNSGYKYSRTIVFGTDLLTDSSADNLGVYYLQNALSYNTKISDANTNSPASIPYFDVRTGTTRIVVPVSNTGSEAKVLRYYGMQSMLRCYSSISSDSSLESDILVSYYELPEPITIQPGETKNIQVEINVGNL